MANRGYDRTHTARDEGRGSPPLASVLPHYINGRPSPRGLLGAALRAAVLLAGLAVVAPGAHGSDFDPHRKLDVATPVLTYGGAHLADYLVTRDALRRGYGEGNPAVRRVGLTGSKAAGFVILAGADIYLQKRGPRWSPWALRVATVVGYGVVIAHGARR